MLHDLMVIVEEVSYFVFDGKMKNMAYNLEQSPIILIDKNGGAKELLRVQFERMRTSFFPSNREYAMQYGISKQLVEKLDNDLLIMHPGPINRGVEISSDLADSEHAIILDQVENGVAVRMAILYLLASKI